MENKIKNPSKSNIIEIKIQNIENFNKLNYFRNLATNLLVSNHNSDNKTIYKKIINDIVYNEKSHIVAKFKDFLIFDDCSEFLKR